MMKSLKYVVILYFPGKQKKLPRHTIISHCPGHYEYFPLFFADPVSPPLNATYLLGLRQLIVRLLLGHLKTLGVGLVELLYLAGVLLCQLPLSGRRLLL